MQNNNIIIMLTLHPQFIKDADGKKSMVVLSAKEYEEIMEELDMIEDVRLYDEAKKEDDGERIPMEEAFKMIEAKRKNK
jgi:PHD/YefM family antitoxin component YafN of YafNO toxin-antitoxin module